MINRLTWFYIVFSTNALYYIGGSTFLFSNYSTVKDVRIHVYKSTFRLGYNLLAFSVNVAYILFIIYRVLYSYFSRDEKNPLTFAFAMQMTYFFLSYSLPAMFQIEMFLRGADLPKFILQYLKFFSQVHERYADKGIKNNFVKVNKFITAMFVIGILVNFENTALLLKKPYKPQFFTSVFVDPFKVPLYYRLPLILFQMWVWINTWVNIYFYVFHIYLYANCGLFFLRELSPNNKNARTISELRNFKDGHKVVEGFEVVNRMFHFCFQTYFLPMHIALAIGIATCAVYGSIRLSGPRAVIMGVVAPLSLTYLAILTRKMGLLYEVSSKIKRDWLHSPTAGKYIKKVLIAQPELRVDVGNFYFVKKSTVLTLFWGIFNFTVNLLVAY